MNRSGDEQPPTGYARPLLPTEIEQPDPPPDDNARPYLPTEIEHPYQPTEYSPPRLQTGHAGPVLPTDIEDLNWPAYSGHREPPAAGPSAPRPGDRPAQAGWTGPAPELTRYGPGVPAALPADTAHTAERIWQAGRPARRPRPWRSRAGAALTVIFLAAAAVVLYVRLHHAPIHVTGVAITQQTQTGCGVDVTGQITTNGAAGTVSYQWLFQPGEQAPQPLSKSVAAGDGVVYVTVAVQGSGHGSASRTVTLQVLGPDTRTDAISVHLRC
jgi:hypothetical protein